MLRMMRISSNDNFSSIAFLNVYEKQQLSPMNSQGISWQTESVLPTFKEKDLGPFLSLALLISFFLYIPQKFKIHTASYTTYKIAMLFACFKNQGSLDIKTIIVMVHIH